MLAEFNWTNTITSSPIFIVLIGFSIVTLGIALERIVYYWRRRDDADGTLERATKKIKQGNLREALWECERSVHPMGLVATEVFKNVTAAAQSLEERLQIALSRQKLLLERNLNVLGTMAAVAPLVGLLGTVWGIMRAFSNMAKTGSAAPSIVAAGVAEALVTTAAGLIVAVPALMLYNHLTRKMNVMLTEAENHSRTLRATLIETALESGQDTPPAGSADGQQADTRSTVHSKEPSLPQPLVTR
jgi:biopolymer transport protein ExbB